MITNDTIANLYSTFATEPALFEDRGLTRLMDYAFDTDAIEFDGDRLVFTTMDQDSPMRSVEIERIYGAKEFDDYLAVVLPNSIIFLDRCDYSTHVHVKECEENCDASVQ